MKKCYQALMILSIITGSAPQFGYAATMFESADILTPAEALGRFQWLNQCYPGLLLEVHDQIFDPTIAIPNSEKIANLKEALLYRKGSLRSDANYLTFGDENNENPQRWYAGKSLTDSCYQIPSDYQISSVLVASKIPSYCEPTSKDTEYEYIKSVSLSGVENISKASAYSNFIGQVLEVDINTASTIHLTPGFTEEGKSYYETFHVYIDWNQDGEFSGTGEIHSAGVTKTGLSYSITPPATALTGLTKMRITMDYFGGSQNACENLRTGEIEDYLLLVK